MSFNSPTYVAINRPTPIENPDWTNAVIGDGRYRVRRMLGEGGMGRVYLADDLRLNSMVVIKTPLANLAQDVSIQFRFGAEIRALVELAHPHVVRIVDVGSHQNLPFFVTQYLSGGSLEDRMASPRADDATMTPAGVLRWLPLLAESMDFIHARGFLHRDVKPANIFFDAHDNIFLGDFGITGGHARRLAQVTPVPFSENETQSDRGGAMLLGSPYYVAPESVTDRAYSALSDQYSLAVTLYEMYAGRLPFVGGNTMGVLVAKCSDPPRELRHVAPVVSVGLSDAIMRGLARVPDDRFPNCAEFAKAVCAGIASAKPTAKPGQRVKLWNETRVSNVSMDDLLINVADHAGQLNAKFWTDGATAATISMVGTSGWLSSLTGAKDRLDFEIGFDQAHQDIRVDLKVSCVGPTFQTLDWLQKARAIAARLCASIEAKRLTMAATVADSSTLGG